MIQVAIVAQPGMEQNRLFDVDAGRDRCFERYVILREVLGRSGIRCDTFDMCDGETIDVLIFSDIRSNLKEVVKAIHRNPSVRLLYMPTEPPVVSFLHEGVFLSNMPFDKILFWNDDFVKSCEHAEKCNIGQPLINVADIPIFPFNDKLFLAAVYSNKLIRHDNGLYEDRLRAFEFFSDKPEGFDLYGVGWDQSRQTFVRRCYRGPCDSKKDVLKNYKYAICFENARYPGLITEKIFDCFAAGTVPIYYGAPNVQVYIPKTCFIDFRDFHNYEDLYQFLVAMTEDEYQCYLDAVKEFITSPEYYEFTSKRFAEIVLEQVQALLNESRPNRTAHGFKWALLKIVLRHPIFFLKNLKRCRRFLFDLAMEW